MGSQTFGGQGPLPPWQATIRSFHVWRVYQTFLFPPRQKSVSAAVSGEDLSLWAARSWCYYESVTTVGLCEWYPRSLGTTETTALTDVGTAHTNCELQSRQHCTAKPLKEARELRASAHRLNHQRTQCPVC